LSDKKFWLGLKLIPELDRRLNQAIECFGSPQHVWEATPKDLIEKLGTLPDVAQKIVTARNKINLDTEFQRLESEGIELLTPSDSDYPMLLREIHSPPILFIKGDLIKRYTHAVAIVGARRASIYGKTIAEELAEELSKLGITIISGLARGIDSHAHLGALKGGGGTIGVLGCGLDIVYPPENRKLYRKISDEGSLISEQPLGTPPFAQNFPARNRIISGLSLGVVIVEAGEKSGALITADFALEQGREVMVVPGNIKNPLTRGCHGLLKQGACLVEKVEDVMEALNLDVEPKSEYSKTSSQDLSSEEKMILDKLDWEPKHLEELVKEVNLDISQVLGLLTTLELKGFVRQDFGKKISRI